MKDNYLTEDDIDRIAERAAEKVLSKVYAEIGQSVVKKAMYVIGIGCLAVLVMMSGKDILK
ncbi:MAG: hypothetical protein ACO23R_02610 [bacterium]